MRLVKTGSVYAISLLPEFHSLRAFVPLCLRAFFLHNNLVNHCPPQRHIRILRQLRLFDLFFPMHNPLRHIRPDRLLHVSHLPPQPAKKTYTFLPCHYFSHVTSATGAFPHAPRHSNSTSVNLPSEVVSPTSITSFCRIRSVIALDPHSSHESDRQTCNKYFPFGFSQY